MFKWNPSLDFLEGCSKLWLKLIIEHIVKKRWVTWKILENLITNFPYRGTDARSRPATMREAKMKPKASRKIVGTFSEVSTLIRTLPQVLFKHIKVTRDIVT